jgi:hypothetical protein
MSNVITLENSASYATEANLDRAIAQRGLDCYCEMDHQRPLRFIKCRNAEGRWTAVFMVSEFFRVNNTGGYVGLAHPFMAV